ncbi:CoA-acylating methylmalonate-semialdehyde dehydrogenase [Bowmanella dokdonensis]|uniref:methylmalonate-semialdehyde dehydrogenase (CoA acylating) n=1 Tax=Bowmanella dokdonensis TaxID=751969 RepID=A0A939ISX9_9ALTE|nr:CoA-acylating methylmalonate-semialdehyde dehydrogenase [Bowmanella dokdonensis]MBN7827639.1 CoA-acylating methylmalonate-semialdehyde dehydrogenase [Bowmanella dokdonensis]
MQSLSHWINNQAYQADETCLDDLNPADGTLLARVPVAGLGTVNQAVAAAVQAQKAWAAQPVHKRAQIMFNFRGLISAHHDELVELISLDNGKTLADAKGELQRGLEVVEYACGAPELLKGEHSRRVSGDIDSWSEFHSLGVVLGITPFNFPAMVPLWMIPMALICGNAFVLKPSEKVPMVANRLAELLAEAGLPAGVFSVVHGNRNTAELLIDHLDIQAVSFVGSTAAAKAIYQRAAAGGKRVQALGGAKNHAVIMPDADLDNAASTLIGAAYGGSGQRCMAISVAVCVEDGTADRLIQHLLPRLDELKVAGSQQQEADMGPLIDEMAVQRVGRALDEAHGQGAALIRDGRQSPLLPERGCFVGPSLVDHVQPRMSCYQQEIFGPVLSVVRVNSLDEALTLANQHEYGNGACIFTESGAAASEFTSQMQAGMVGVNVPLPVPMAFHSFGGWKQSLFGDLLVYGPDGVRFYTKRKTITQRWLKSTGHSTAFGQL